MLETFNKDQISKLELAIKARKSHIAYSMGNDFNSLLSALPHLSLSDLDRLSQEIEEKKKQEKLASEKSEAAERAAMASSMMKSPAFLQLMEEIWLVAREGCNTTVKQTLAVTLELRVDMSSSNIVGMLEHNSPDDFDRDDPYSVISVDSFRIAPIDNMTLSDDQVNALTTLLENGVNTDYAEEFEVLVPEMKTKGEQVREKVIALWNRYHTYKDMYNIDMVKAFNEYAKNRKE